MTEPRFSAVELLTPAHRVDEFNCGSDDESLWLRSHGVVAQHSGSSRVYVVRRLADDRVIAFDALSAGAVLALEAAGRMAASDADYPISVITLTRLGVDLSEQGQGLGRGLLVDALRRINAAADIVGVRALLIHAANLRARDFYQVFAEFENSPTDPLHLLLLIKDLRRSLA